MFSAPRLTIISSTRRLSTVPEMMSAWVCSEYKRPLIRRQVRVPEISEANQILVKVQASSVNPIDVRMCEGYAHNMLDTLANIQNIRPDRLVNSFGKSSQHQPPSQAANFEPNPMPAPPGPVPTMNFESPTQQTAANPMDKLPNLPKMPKLSDLPDPRKLGDKLPNLYHLSCSSEQTNRLPLIPGRDFCGQVVSVGSGVEGVHVGDQVIGVCPATGPGAHAEFALTTDDRVALKPQHVTEIEAASLVFTMATVWSALAAAHINASNADGHRFLIHGGSGGVGRTAIQLLRAWNAQKVVATASAKNLDSIRQLGAVAVDYKAADVKDQLIRESPFDVILDCAHSPLTEWSDTLLGTWRNSIHLSLISPAMTNTDRYGVPLGLMATAAQLISRNLRNITRGRLFTYAFYYPDREAFVQLSELMDSGKLKPIVDEVRPFTDLPAAYENVARGRGGGKTVLDFAAPESRA